MRDEQETACSDEYTRRVMLLNFGIVPNTPQHFSGFFALYYSMLNPCPVVLCGSSSHSPVPHPALLLVVDNNLAGMIQLQSYCRYTYGDIQTHN